MTQTPRPARWEWIALAAFLALSVIAVYAKDIRSWHGLF